MKIPASADARIQLQDLIKNIHAGERSESKPGLRRIFYHWRCGAQVVLNLLRSEDLQRREDRAMPRMADHTERE